MLEDKVYDKVSVAIDNISGADFFLLLYMCINKLVSSNFYTVELKNLF